MPRDSMAEAKSLIAESSKRPVGSCDWFSGDSVRDGLEARWKSL